MADDEGRETIGTRLATVGFDGYRGYRLTAACYSVIQFLFLWPCYSEFFTDEELARALSIWAGIVCASPETLRKTLTPDQLLEQDLPEKIKAAFEPYIAFAKGLLDLYHSALAEWPVPPMKTLEVPSIPLSAPVPPGCVPAPSKEDLERMVVQVQALGARRNMGRAPA